eukprot:CAMPEP_0198303904 /NCGR_PEP_ID=MMETSP1449-20131203/57127_1 /TAXON_ID=420275 /ORGANISM="Attheya septentrionalis, Strain CCMP2084" /LENGTH=78 /DNA_ID=CAMNT_0044006411 /DNA_START=132 /DNA_END=368 /DNA_ORIENTATION=+
MTRSNAVWVTGVEANVLGDDKPTSSRTSISLPFEDTRDDDDDEEEDFFDAEAGCIQCNMTEDDDEKENQKGSSGRKKP